MDISVTARPHSSWSEILDRDGRAERTRRKGIKGPREEKPLPRGRAKEEWKGGES